MRFCFIIQKKSVKKAKPTPKKVEKAEPVPVKKESAKKPAPVKKEGDVATVKKEKKVFEKFGQKYETPYEFDFSRLFYESLYIQKGTASAMARKWCMERGLLNADDEKAARKA